ncbi:MAG: aldehyde dehydrogenase family protein [Rhodospirillales bacterium]|nr:aldehyde dehydrogenase family protein [Rhodospirillales bacterium]
MNPFQELFDRQKRHFATGMTRSRGWRIEQLDRMSRLVAENETALQQAIGQDFKTANQEQIFETLACLGEVAFQKSQLDEWMKPVEAPVPRALAATGHRGVVYRDPYGVALIIGPFNGPLLLLLRPAIGALAAGNCCVLKLSVAIEATSSLLVKLVPKYFEPEAVAAVAGHREETTELLKLPFDFIFFTGSTSTGKIVSRAAAENLTPVVLELGGQNPALVDETANIKDAAKKIVWGAMAWGGQWCTSPGYAYVHESIAEEFVAEAKAALIGLFGEDPKSNPDYSRVISAHEVTRLVGLIDPAKVIIGGRSDPAARYLDPTIVYPVTWDNPIMEEEVFGPILPILTYRTLDEALGRIAATPHPLAAFIFSREQKAIDRFIGELSFGGGAVNQVNVHLFIVTMPFGGVGPAGMGRYYGKDGFDMLTHAKSLLISPPDVAIDHLFPPFTPEKNADLKIWFEY